MATFRVASGRSQVWIEASSSLHPIHGEASGLEGTIEAEISDGKLDLSESPKIRIELPVDKLKSGKALEDAEMMRRIDARKFPTIRGEVREIREAPGGGYHMTGDLTFHGVTRPVEGEQTFDIRDFGVQPPKILMLKVHPDVKVRVRLVAEKT